MIPEIIFRYSKVYDEVFKDVGDIKRFLKKNKQEYPSEKKISNYTMKIFPVWRKVEKKVLTEISKVMNFKWKEKEVICYVVGICTPLPNPLTLMALKNKNKFIDVLVHEMIHQMQRQNSETMKKWWAYAGKKYKKEKPKTVNHILLFAVYKKVYLKIFDKKRLNRVFKKYKTKPYKRSLEIVEKEGHEEIIKKFREVTK